MTRCCCCLFTQSLIIFLTGLTIILAGYMRLTIINNNYIPTECVVITHEIQEVRGVCIAGKCSPSEFYGKVEFKIPNGREIWTTVIQSYDKNVVVNYMGSHFTVNKETQCYISHDGHLIFQLNPTNVLLAISVTLLIVSFLSFSVMGCFIYRENRKRKDYIDLDEETDNL